MRIKRWFIVFLCIFAVIGSFIIVQAADNPKAKEAKKEAADKKEPQNNLYDELELFADAFSLIKENYVDERTDKELIYGALKGMLSSLDDHSQFLDADEYKELQVDTKGEFGGIGIEISVRDSLLTIISPIEDTPAWNAGVKAGDRIVKIEGELTKSITLLDAVKKLRGEPGTKVTITILREDEEKGVEVKDITITRAIIKVKDIKDVQEVDKGIGYVRLTEFREKTPQQLELALKDLEKKGIDSLILDLRNNPGGLLDVAVKVSERFIEPNKLVVYTQGRNASQKMEFKSKNKKPYLNWPMVILVNGGSASASEIVSGCLKDYKRAILLGTKTFGKGSVQTVVPLREGTGLRLTTSKYYTPSGRSIHGLGIEPDVLVKPGTIEVKEAKEDIFEQIKEQHKEATTDKDKGKEKEVNKDKPEVKTDEELKNEEKFKKDNQLVRAIDLLKGIRVYQQTK